MKHRSLKIFRKPLDFNEQEWFTLTTYKIVRQWTHNDNRRTVARGVTLAVAQAHCNDPETCSQTCKGRTGKARTRRSGPWADHYYVDRVQYVRRTA